MKTLVIYYSRTGTTRTVAKQITQKLNCDSEEIIDEKNRKGVLGFLLASRDTILNKLTTIKKINSALSAYDLIIIGGPVWVGNMSVPIRTFISHYLL